MIAPTLMRTGRTLLTALLALGFVVLLAPAADVPTREEMTLLRGHSAYVYSLAFSPDGRMLVSGSGDHTVRVWDTRPVRERWGSLRGPMR